MGLDSVIIYYFGAFHAPYVTLFRLSKYVRIQLLGDTDIGKNRKIPPPKINVIQQGNLILKEIDELPKDAKRIY